MLRSFSPVTTYAALLVSLGLAATSPPRRETLPAGTLVVSNMIDHSVTVIDAASGRVHATLPTGEGPHEVAISHDGRWAFVSNYGVRGKPGNTITVIDVPAARVVRTLTLDGYQRPHGMVFLPGDTLVAVTAEAGQALLVVDARDGKVVRALPTKGRASHMVAVTADGALGYTANIADGTISRIDLRGVDSTRVTPVGRAPESIAVTPDGAQVWVGSNRDSTVLVIDPRRGVTTDTLRAFGMPYRIVISPDGRQAVISDPVKAEVRVFSVADRRSRFTIAIPRDSLVATAEVPGSPSPEGVAISRDSRWAFVTLQGRNRAITIDLTSGAIVAWAPTGTWSDGIGFSPLSADARPDDEPDVDVRTVPMTGPMPAPTAQGTAQPTAQSTAEATAPPTGQPSKVRAFTGFTLIDGTDRPPVPNATLVVRDGRIVAAGSASAVTIPAGAERVALDGRTVIPGLINAHGHVNQPADLSTYAAYGVTTIYSLGGEPPSVFAARDAQATPALDHARVFVSGAVVTAKTPDEARADVAKLAEQKVDVVKIRVDDNLGTVEKMPPAVYRAVLDAAHARGLRVAAHLFYLADAKDLLASGADYIAHSVRDARVDPALIAQFRQTGVCITPTLMREVSTFVYESTPDFFSDSLFLMHANREWMKAVQEPARQAAMRASPAAQRYKVALKVASDNLKLLAQAGVPIAMGTDTGPQGRFQGYFELMELELMVKAGLTPRQVITAATRDAARCIKRDRDLGTLEAGKWGDFVVLDGDPLADIANVRRIASVWIAGNRVAR